MKLYELLKGIRVKAQPEDCEISFLTSDTRKVREGSVFVCIKGEKFDGHSAAEEMLKKGAVCVVCEYDLGLKEQVIVNNTRNVFSVMCSNYFGNPAKKLRLIGITGTNGKTTTTFLIKNILSILGKKAGLIGTVVNMVGENEYPSSFTTPESYELQELFSKMVEENCEYCIMEVSSQALAQGRVDGLKFDVGIFSNLTQDHLDYHKTIENYADAKAKLFTNSSICVVNLDDKYAGRMVMDTKGKILTYSAKNPSADYLAKYIDLKADGIEYDIISMREDCHVKLPIPGDFSVYNSLAAVVGTVALGFDENEVVYALSQCTGVKGRIEVVPTDTDYTVIIDYAHSPDGLENIISSLRKIAKKRIITVFGCGGDRDKTKRPIMGMIAGKMSDCIVVTSDNPRSEDPNSIIDMILDGIKGLDVEMYVETDRTKAISLAMSKAEKDDIVLLAGKGHETYQILSTGKIHYDEREIVRDILKQVN